MAVKRLTNIEFAQTVAAIGARTAAYVRDILLMGDGTIDAKSSDADALLADLRERLEVLERISR